MEKGGRIQLQAVFQYSCCKAELAASPAKEGACSLVRASQWYKCDKS